MCAFNLDQKQAEIKQKCLYFDKVPVLYFTQLIGIALGLDYRSLGFEQNAVDPLPMLQAKGLLQVNDISTPMAAKGGS